MPRRPARRSRRRLVVLLSSLLGLALAVTAAMPVLRHYEIWPFSDQGARLDFGRTAPDASGAGSGDHVDAAPSGTRLPSGPWADFRVAHRLDDGTHIGVVTYRGPMSGFTGRVWVWAPKAYFDPRFARSGFPVLIALPGGPGFPDNYWADPSLRLEESIGRWYAQGRSKPFLLAMPVLNPATDKGGLYWDGSDIPGQPRMGTWLTQDVPDLMRANFRTLDSRDGWAFLGSSSGGFAGLKAVLQFPGRFKAVLASGPDIVPDSPLWRGHESEQRQNDPRALARALIARGGPDVYLAFQVGSRENRATVAAIRDFVAAYGKGPVHTQLHVIPGGRHNAYTYVPAMADGPVEWISSHLQGPTPAR
ncbi:alpha/beta hydrolase [Streptacidiphilus monticola]|uniref:Alpha/beta hydrolase n=1 Tax=Streptacidiphilus monticola TaxID=2161674 RepID=A0ABW1FVT5_9ACTN